MNPSQFIDFMKKKLPSVSNILGKKSIDDDELKNLGRQASELLSGSTKGSFGKVSAGLKSTDKKKQKDIDSLIKSMKGTTKALASNQDELDRIEDRLDEINRLIFDNAKRNVKGGYADKDVQKLSATLRRALTILPSVRGKDNITERQQAELYKAIYEAGEVVQGDKLDSDEKKLNKALLQYVKDESRQDKSLNKKNKSGDPYQKHGELLKAALFTLMGPAGPLVSLLHDFYHEYKIESKGDDEDNKESKGILRKGFDKISNSVSKSINWLGKVISTSFVGKMLKGFTGFITGLAKRSGSALLGIVSPVTSRLGRVGKDAFTKGREFVQSRVTSVLPGKTGTVDHDKSHELTPEERRERQLYNLEKARFFRKTGGFVGPKTPKAIKAARASNAVTKWSPTALLKGSQGAAKRIAAGSLNVASKAASGLGDIAGMIMKAAMPVLTGIAGAVLPALSGLAAMALPAIGLAAAAYIGYKAGTALWDALPPELQEGISSIIGGAVDLISSAVDSVTDFFKTMPDKLEKGWHAVTELFDSFATWFKDSKIGKLLGTVTDAGKSFLGSVSSVSGAAADAYKANGGGIGGVIAGFKGALSQGSLNGVMPISGPAGPAPTIMGGAPMAASGAPMAAMGKTISSGITSTIVGKSNSSVTTGSEMKAPVTASAPMAAAGAPMASSGQQSVAKASSFTGTGKNKFGGFGSDEDKNISDAAQMTGLDEKVLRGFVKMEAGWNGKMSPTGAIGAGQFIKGTWNDLAGTKEGQAIGMTPITNANFRKDNDPRRDNRINTLATALLAKRNADLLTKAGIPVTGENLYMVHNIGPGIIDVMQGKEASPAVLKAMQQNGMKPGQSAQDFLGYQKDRFNAQYSIANSNQPSNVANMASNATSASSFSDAKFSMSGNSAPSASSDVTRVPSATSVGSSVSSSMSKPIVTSAVAPVERVTLASTTNSVKPPDNSAKDAPTTSLGTAVHTNASQQTLDSMPSLIDDGALALLAMSILG